MRLGRFLCLLFVVTALAACGPGPGPIGGDDDDDNNNNNNDSTSPTDSGTDNPSPTPSEDPTLPSYATFEAQIHGGINGNCDGCHVGGSGGMVLVFNNPTNAEKYLTYINLICCPRMYEYELPVGGRFFDMFCNGPGNAKGSPSHPDVMENHSAFGQSNNLCQNWYDWQLEPQGLGGNPDLCFLAQDPMCD